MLVLAMHLGALVSVWLAATPNTVQLLTSLVVAISLQQVWRRQVVLTDARAVRQLLWQAGGDWQLVFASGETRQRALRRPYYVTPWLAVLRFAGSTVVLMPDALDADAWRQLRVGLLTMEVDG